MSELMDDIRKRGLDEQDKAELLKNPVTHDMMVALERLLEVSNKIVTNEPPMGKPADIWELATEESRRRAKSIEEVTTIYILGSDGGGKTSLLNLFLERKETTGEKTLALDFSFARRVNTMLEKEVCQFWELGGDPREWTNLINIPVLGCNSLNRLTAFVVLDLSQPISIWPVLEKVMSGLQSGFKEAMRKMDKSQALNLSQDLEEKMRSRLESIPEDDRQYLKPFHLPIVLVGTKYDLFQNLEPETVKTVSRVLRLTAHIIGASLLFYTREDYKLKRRFRELVSHYAFNTKFPQDTCFENGECLFIPAGMDTFEQIWPSQKPAQYTLDFCKRHYESKIGKDAENTGQKHANPADDPRFAEPAIDRLREKYLEEIDKK